MRCAERAEQKRAEELLTSTLTCQVLWSDIDYMDKFKDFTLNPTSYAAPKMQVGMAALM